MAISKEELYPIIIEIILQELEERLPLHKEIVDLKSAVERLALSQNQTEKRIDELIQAQKRTEEELKTLTEAQRKSEERFSRVELVIENLTEAHKKAEERISRLEVAVEALAEAQRITEEEIRELTLVVKNMQKQLNGITKELGGLSHSIGFQLEDRAYRSLPHLLKRDFGIEVKEKLIRKFIKDKKGEPMEINILGKGERDGKDYSGRRKSKSLPKTHY